MGLVSETRMLSNLGQRQIAIFQKRDRAIDAAAQNELMYRQLRRLAKGGGEGASWHSRYSGKMVDRHPLFQIAVNRSEDAVEPLRGQDRRLLPPLPCMPENIASNSSTDPIPHAPATSAGFHHGSEYQPAGTGRPATRPPG